jgi:hypothetical protein
MRTLTRTSKVVILAAIGGVAILSFRAFAQPYPKPTEPPASKATFVLEIKNVTSVKDAARFEDVLKHLKTQIYDVVMYEGDGTQKHLVPGSSANLKIKTDKITTSEVAENESPSGHTRNPSGHTRNPSGHTRNPGVTRNIASMYSSDIKTVLDELQE